MKIIYVITGLGLGGAETQVCNLADKFHELGHDVTVVYLFGDKVISPNNAAVSVIGLDLENTLFSLLKVLLRLSRLIKQLAPDVVHSHMVHANLICRFIRLFTPVNRLICTAHNSNEGGRLRMLLYRLSDRLGDVFTNVGETSVSRFVELGASPSNSIFSMVNGIDIDKFSSTKIISRSFRNELGIQDTTRLFLAVGRYDDAKDYPNLLNAINLITQDLDFHVAVIGINTELLNPLADKLQVSNKVSFLGLRKDVAQLMAQADALVMSSAWEGLPIVIGEAMSSNCNVITTDAGGCREWLSPYELPVPIKNSQALADAMTTKLLQSDEQWKMVGAANRDYVVKHFSLDSVVHRWLIIYEGANSLEQVIAVMSPDGK